MGLIRWGELFSKISSFLTLSEIPQRNSMYFLIFPSNRKFYTIAKFPPKLKLQTPQLQVNEKQKLYIQGPNQGITTANNEQKSWPSVAPAPMNPNNLEPN